MSLPRPQRFPCARNTPTGWVELVGGDVTRKHRAEQCSGTVSSRGRIATLQPKERTTTPEWALPGTTFTVTT